MMYCETSNTVNLRSALVVRRAIEGGAAITEERLGGPRLFVLLAPVAA